MVIIANFFVFVGAMCSLQLPLYDGVSRRQHWNGKIYHYYWHIPILQYDPPVECLRYSNVFWLQLQVCVLIYMVQQLNNTCLLINSENYNQSRVCLPHQSFSFTCRLMGNMCANRKPGICVFLSLQDSQQSGCEYVISPLNPSLSKGCAKYCNTTKQVRSKSLTTAPRASVFE